MSIFRFNKCCCIFELTTGGIIMGWINIIMSIALFVVCCVVLADVDRKEENFASVKLICGIIIFIVSLLMISDALLILGSMHKKPSYIVPWLFNEAVFLLLNFIGIFLCPDFASILAGIAYFTFRLYLWLCVYSLHATLKEWPAAGGGNFAYSEKTLQPGYLDM